MTQSAHQIPVLQKAIEVMTYIGAHPGKVTQSELIAALDIPQATCYRIVATLTAAGWLSKTNGKYLDISSALLPLTRKVSIQLERYRVLQPVIDHLARKVGYSVKLSVRDGAEQLNVLCAKAPWDIALTTTVGARESLFTGGSVGAILIAGMKDAERAQLNGCGEWLKSAEKKLDGLEKSGYIFNAAGEGDRRWQVDALSVPVKNSDGDILGALTILSLPGGIAPEKLEALAGEMSKAAEFCSDTMA